MHITMREGRRTLCFLCDDKFTPAHKCEKRRIQNMECYIAEERTEEVQEAAEELCNHEAAVSMYAINGSSVYNTVKLQGKIRNRPVVILIVLAVLIML